MLMGCKNCGAYFTRDEVLKRKPPVHPWPLTEVGQRVLAENQASGHATWPCPSCGHATLKSATPSSSAM